MLKLSDLHARHHTLTLSLVLCGFKTPGTRLWFIVPPPVLKTLQWPVGQRLRSKVSHAALVMTPLRQASALRKALPRKRTAVDQLRQDLAWQACLKELRRSAKTKGLVKRQGTRPVWRPISESMHREPVVMPRSIDSNDSKLLAQPSNAHEQETSTDACGHVPLVRFRWRIKQMEIVFLLLLLVLLVLVFVVPMTLYALRHVFQDEPPQKVTHVQNAGRVISVSLGGGCLTRSLVETDLGYYALVDGISLARGEAMTLETREGKTRFLCDSRHRCLRLDGR